MYFIAEIGSNHNGSMIVAQKLIQEAEKAGANAVKFQSWTPDSLYARQWLAENPAAHEELAKHSLSPDKLRYLARNTGIDFICSVFSNKEVDELEDTVDMYKIASMDITNIELLEHVASKKKPVILSCGMASMEEVAAAVHVFSVNKYTPLTLLHCVSLYPPRYDQVNLGRMDLLRKLFNTSVGYSDHTPGVVVPLAAVAMGASMIEKHFTLDKDMPGWDHRISANPQEFAHLVREAQIIEYARRVSVNADTEAKLTMRRSVVSKRDIYKGEVITENDIIYRRPGTGLSKLPHDRTARRDIPGGCLISKDDLQ